MLTTSQTANILAKAGIIAPAFPARRLPVQERDLHEGARNPQQELGADAEEAQQLDMLRRAGDRPATPKRSQGDGTP